MQYVINYKLFFRTFNKEVEDIIKADYVLSYFNGKRNYNIYKEVDTDGLVIVTHKPGKIDKLFKIPQEIYDSEYSRLGATSVKT